MLLQAIHITIRRLGKVTVKIVDFYVQKLFFLCGYFTLSTIN